MVLKRFQNRIAESRFSLPSSVSILLLMLLFIKPISIDTIISIGCLGISTYIIVEIDHANSLIRIYSRIMACSFLSLMTLLSTNPDIILEYHSLLVQLCLIIFYGFFFKAYQNKYASGSIYYAFIFIGIASLFFVKILYFIPLLWILLFANILAFNVRTFWASILGTLTPYWFMVGYYLLKGDTETMIYHIKELADFKQMFDYSDITEHKIVTFVFITILSATGIIHYIRNNYTDKIKTRMLYESIISINILSLVFISIMPHYYTLLISIIIINTSALIGHYIALTHTWFTNASFVLMLITTLFIIVYNIWMPSLIY